MARGWFVREGRLRTPWRVLLFICLFVAFLLTGGFLAGLLVPSLAEPALPSDDGLPAGFIAQFAIVLAAVLAATWVMRVLVDRRPADGLGFPLTRRVPLVVATGIGAGALAMAVVVGSLSLVGVFRYGADEGTVGGWLAVIASSLAAFAIPAAAEEAMFRGYLLRTISEGAGPLFAVLVTSAAFAMAHGANPDVAALAVVNIFLAGVLLSVAVIRTGALWLATAVHLGWNWVMAGPLDLPVSGVDPYDVPLYDVLPATPAWLSGGAFGPEGGLAGTAAACVALALVIWLTRPGALLGPAVPDRRT